MGKKKTIKIEMTENQLFQLVFGLMSIVFLIIAAMFIVTFFSLPILFGVASLCSFLFVMYGSHIMMKKSEYFRDKDKN